MLRASATASKPAPWKKIQTAPRPRRIAYVTIGVRSVGFSSPMGNMQGPQLAQSRYQRKTEGGNPMTLSLKSSAFVQEGKIPSTFTCEGKDVSPPLEWTGVPEGTKSFALIVDDPDAPDPRAPKMTWVHWVLYDISPTVTSLPEGAGKKPPAGAKEGINDWKRTGYGGPCPPI